MCLGTLTQSGARAGRTAPFLALVGFLASTALGQPAAERQLLNSERIERDFGSYGIEVLEQDESVRVSDLYSGTGDERVTRTFAVVLYPEEPDAAYAEAHSEIVAGGSIGAVFTRRGWSVSKQHRFFGQLDSTPQLEDMMQIAPRSLATHVYVLEVARGDVESDYATIVEMHHPGYLTLDDVRKIYGAAYEPPVSMQGLKTLVDVLERAARRAEAHR